jgi:hypothetical protein
LLNGEVVLKINSGFGRLTSVKFAAQVELIIASLTGNANFPEPWPASLATLAQLQADLTALQDTLNAIATRDHSRIVDRDAARQKLVDELIALAHYLQSVAKGDPTMLATTGFPARKVSPRALSPASLAAPDRIKLSHGPLSGQLIVQASRVLKAASYDVQITTADPTVDSNWNDAGIYTTCRRIALSGLTPGKVYSVRMRAFGAAGAGAWTAASSLMVI